MADLPDDRERALVVIARGWGRKPTRAHPSCTCPPLGAEDPRCSQHGRISVPPDTTYEQGSLL